MRKIIRRLIPKKLLEARAKAAEVRRHQHYKNLPLGEVFSRIYEQREWGGDNGFYSGSGSHDLAIVESYVGVVSSFLSGFEVKPVVVDLGSGDFNIGKHFVDFANYYYACDIVVGLQEFNRHKYNYKNVEFLFVNAVDDPLPIGDVIVIRQVLQHLSNSQIMRIIEKCYDFPYWLITEHLPDTSTFKPNIDIDAGSGIRILFDSGVDLLAPPFNVKGYSHRILCESSEYGGVIRTTLFERVHS